MTALNPAPTTTAEILDPRWIGERVYGATPGIEVIGAEVVWTLATTATKSRVTVTVKDPPPGLITNICIKGMLDEVGKPFVGSGIARTEALFYQDIAPVMAHTALAVPPCLYAGLDPANDHGLIVMEDLVAAGATFLSALTLYTADDAVLSLDQLARLHASAMEGSAVYQLPWAVKTIERMAERSLIPLDLLQELMNGPRGDPLPAHVRDATRLHRSLGELAERFRAQPTCLIHGDAHAGNLYRLNGDVGLIDWQLVQQGNWAQDVAYHLAAALLPEDRRAHERALLDHYLERLVKYGGPAIDREAAWDSYRSGMLYGYYLWSITRRVEPAIINEFVRRLGTAVADLESFQLVES